MKRFAMLGVLLLFLAFSAQSWGAPQSGQLGEILRAEYGYGNKWTDVSQRVFSLARGDVLRFRVNDATLGVTSPRGAESTLRIFVRARNGQTRRFNFRENRNMNLRGYAFNATAFGGLHILRGTYGYGSRTLDVTDRLNAQVRDGRLNLRVTNDTMGSDPASGQDKTLTVRYIANGREDQIVVNEGDNLSLSSGNDTFSNLRISRARYGTSARSNDVTDRLNSQIRDGRLSLQVNNDTMGGDPDSNRQKTLTVSYTLDGRSDQVTVSEGEYLSLPAGYGTGVAQTVRCESANYQRNYCSVNTRGGVSLTRKLGTTDCVRGTSWGSDSNGIWVDNGCRADFEVLSQAGSNSGSVGSQRLISNGTQFSIRTNEVIDSKTAREGQRFSAVMEADVLDNAGTLAVPKGSDVELVIRSTEGSDLVLDVDSIVVAGRRYDVSTEDLEQKGREGIGANKRTAVMVGGGAAIGAVIGAIVGGGKGAAIGAAIGAAGGAGAQVLTKGKEVSVPSETVLSFRLEQDLYLVPRS